MRDTAIKKLTELAESDSDIVLLNGDLGFGVLDVFTDRYPTRTINAGISEQNMMGMAAGLALCGRKVYVYSIGNFPGMRCIEQIRNDVCYHGLNVNILAVGGGFAYGQLGMSHHATEDLAVMRALPGMRVYAPADPLDAIRVVEEVNEVEGPCYVRLGRGHDTQLDPHTDRCTDLNLVREGGDVAIVTIGTVLKEAIEAADRLEREGVGCTIISIVRMKPFPTEKFLRCLGSLDKVITVEEHNIVGGLGSTVADELMASGRSAKIVKLGLKDCYTSVVGDQDYLRKYYQLSSDDIFKKAMELVGRT